MKVGAGPAPSPLVAGLAGDKLPRIQVFTPEFDHWMSYFAQHPGQRFISDGQRHAAGSLPAAAAHVAAMATPARRHAALRVR